MITPKGIQWQDCEVCWLRRSMPPATQWDSTSTRSQYRLGPKILRSWKLNGSTHPKNAIFHPKDATQTSVEGVHKVPISIRTYGVLGPSEENVLHTNNADPKVQDNPSFLTQMVPISKIIFHIFSRSKWKMNSLHVFDTTMTNPRSNNVFLKIVRFSVCHAQLALAFSRKILQLCGRFLFTRYKLCLCLRKKCKIEMIEIETTFWYEFAKTRKIERQWKTWEEMTTYGKMRKWKNMGTWWNNTILMKQLKRYEQKITGRENETIVCFIVFPEGHNPLDHIVKTVRCRKLL